MNVLVRVQHLKAGWHADIEVETPEKHKLTAAKWVQAGIKKKDRRYPVRITDKGNVIVDVG